MYQSNGFGIFSCPNFQVQTKRYFSLLRGLELPTPTISGGFWEMNRGHTEIFSVSPLYQPRFPDRPVASDLWLRCSIDHCCDKRHCSAGIFRRHHLRCRSLCAASWNIWRAMYRRNASMPVGGITARSPWIFMEESGLGTWYSSGWAAWWLWIWSIRCCFVFLNIWAFLCGR